jgi:putative oxidoreductase
MLRRSLVTTNDLTFTVARLVLGVTFFIHGAQKMLGWFGGFGFHATTDSFLQWVIPAPLAFLAICAEFFGGFALIVGLCTRFAVFGIIANMVVAISKVHSENGFFMNWSEAKGGEGFEYHLLAIALALVVLIKGAGAFSIDEAIGWRAQKTGQTAAFPTRNRAEPDGQSLATQGEASLARPDSASLARSALGPVCSC